MSDENKISLELEVDDRSLNSTFKTVEVRAEKSAKESAVAFETAFQRQEQDLKTALDKLVKDSGKAAQASAKESAAVFQKEFEKQNKILLASQKQNIDNAMSKILNTDAIKKSAAESARAFEDLLPPIPEVKEQVSPFNLTNLAAGVYLFKQAYFAIKEVVTAASSFVSEGEKIQKAEARFASLAEQAGLAADVIQDKLIGAAKGLIDDDKLIQLASESFVQLGRNAERLPEVLEVARKAYKVFGGDVVTNAEKINQAVFTGNTRSLRQIGILVDVNKTYAEYAKSIGTVVPLLTEQQKQQAILNKVLEQGETRFKNVTKASTSYDESLTRLDVAMSDVADEAKKLAASTVGKTFAEGFEESARQLGLIKSGLQALGSSDSVETIKGRVAVLNATLAESRKEYDGLSKVEKFFLAPIHKKIVDEQTNAIARMNAQIAIAQGDLASAQKGLNEKPNATPPDEAVEAERIRRKAELIKKIQDLNAQANQSEVGLAQAQLERQSNLENLEKLSYERRKQAALTFEQSKADLEKFYADNGINDQNLKNEGRQQIERTHVNNLLAIDADYAAKKKEINDGAISEGYALSDSFKDVVAGMKASQAELEANSRKSFKAIGQAARDGLGTSIANGFAAFGAALVNGEDALQAFVNAFLSSIGQMAIQSGARFIMEGLAWLTVPGFQAVGSSMIYAGAALAAFGGALTAVTGGGASASVQSGYGANTTVGGGITGDESLITEPTADEDVEPESPKVQVSLTVQGNILDNRETGLALAQIISDQFADQGLVFRGA